MCVNNDVSMDFVGATEPCGDLGNFEPEIDDDVSQRLLAWMGSSGPQLRRRQRRQRHNPTTAKAIVSKIDSPPRVTKLISELRPRHLLQGLAFDLTTTDKDDGSPWDFSRVKATQGSRLAPGTEALLAHRVPDVHAIQLVAKAECCQD